MNHGKKVAVSLLARLRLTPTSHYTFVTDVRRGHAQAVNGAMNATYRVIYKLVLVPPPAPQAPAARSRHMRGSDA